MARLSKWTWLLLIASWLISSAVGVGVVSSLILRFDLAPPRQTSDLQINAFIDEVKTGLAKAQASYQSDPKGPPFLIKDFDLEVNLQIQNSIQGGISGHSLIVAAANSQGTTHLVKLHFESALYDIAKQIIEECAGKHFPPSGLASLLGPLKLQMETQEFQEDKQLLEKLEKAESDFIDCINKGLPAEAAPVSTIIQSMLKLLLPTEK